MNPTDYRRLGSSGLEVSPLCLGPMNFGTRTDAPTAQRLTGAASDAAANFTDPDGYFVGGGVVEAEPHFRDWFLAIVQEHTLLRAEQREVAEFLVVSDLDMAGARGSAMAALNAIRP